MSECDMKTRSPMDFAWCEAHDETFPLGAVCSEERARLSAAAVSARARGDFTTERRALDALALDDRSRGGVPVSGPQLDIDAIEARAEGAIDGPWELHEMAKDESYGYWPIGYVTDHPNAGLVCEVPDYGYWTAVFIAAARTDVPVLCAEVRQLREQLAWEKSINDGLA